VSDKRKDVDTNPVDANDTNPVDANEYKSVTMMRSSWGMIDIKISETVVRLNILLDQTLFNNQAKKTDDPES
jgi:hypothetical protein